MKQRRGLKVHKKVEPPLPKDGSAGVAVGNSDIAGNNSPSADDIAVLAYSYWEARGYQGGSPVEDWLRAEQVLRGQQAGQRS